MYSGDDDDGCGVEVAGNSTRIYTAAKLLCQSDVSHF